MGLTKEYARHVIDIYIRAWESQDPDLIVTIFTPDATYHERVLGEPIPDRKAIRRYWQNKVVQSQANIRCELLSLYLDGNTVIAEWQAEFDDLAEGMRKQIREIAVLTFEGLLISSLREYWASRVIEERKSHMRKKLLVIVPAVLTAAVAVRAWYVRKAAGLCSNSGGHMSYQEPYDTPNLPPNEVLTTQHTVHRSATRNFSRPPDEQRGVLTKAALVVATVSFAGLVAFVAFFFTYRNSVTAQMSQLRQAVSQGQSSLDKAQSSGAASFASMNGKISDISALLAPFNQVCSQALVDQTGAAGVYYYACSASRP